MWDFLIGAWPILTFLIFMGIPFLYALIWFIISICYTPKSKKK